MNENKFNIVVTANSADEAWLNWYELLSNMNEKNGSRDGDVVGEVINAITVINDPTRCIMQNKVRKMPIRYAIGEMLWYLSGSDKLSAIQNYTSAWDRMSDNGETVNSNYGNCIKSKFGFDQWEYAKQLLMKDKNSRQAIIHIKEARNTIESPTKDLNCTVCLQFLIRKVDNEDKLFMTAYMRSNDIWLGFPFDVFNFSAMQVKMAMELEVGLGTYTHIAGSLHLYERDFLKAKQNLKGEVKNV